MRKARHLLAVLFLTPVLAGCFSVQRVAVPRTAPEREAAQVRGVIVTDGSQEEEIAFETVHEATWTPSSLSVVADLATAEGIVTVTRLIPITELSGLLVRRLDPGRTSAIIAGVFVGGAALIATVVTGKNDDYNLPLTGFGSR